MLLGYGPMEGVSGIWENSSHFYAWYSQQTFTAPGPATSFTFTINNQPNNILMVMGVQVQVTYSQSYTDYVYPGITNSFSLAGNSMLPLYNGLFPFPNSGLISNAGVPYATYNAALGSGTVNVYFPSSVSNVVCKVFYAYHAESSPQPTPLSLVRMFFEAQLGQGHTGNVTTYKEFSGVGGINVHLGTTPVLGQYTFETKGLYGMGNDGATSNITNKGTAYTPARTSGDCCPADVIADIICSGNNVQLLAGGGGGGGVPPGSITFATNPYGNIVDLWWWPQNHGGGIFNNQGASIPLNTATASGHATGNSLMFNPQDFNGTQDPWLSQIVWATLDTSGAITGYTSPMGGTNADFEMALVFSLNIPAAGNYAFDIYHDDGMFFGIRGAVASSSGPPAGALNFATNAYGHNYVDIFAWTQNHGGGIFNNQARAIPLDTSTANYHAVGNSVQFNPSDFNGTEDPNISQLQWATFDTNGKITGYTQPLGGTHADYMMAVVFAIVIVTSGTYTVTIVHDDGAFFGIDNSAVFVSQNEPTGKIFVTQTAVKQYPVMGGYNQNGRSYGVYQVTFPAAGTYNVEIDYFQWDHGAQLGFYVTPLGGTIGYSPIPPGGTVGASGGASLVSQNELTGKIFVTQTAVKQYPVVGGYNQNGNSHGIYVVNFPAAGIYDFEIDYFQWDHEAQLVVQCQQNNIVPSGGSSVGPGSVVSVVWNHGLGFSSFPSVTQGNVDGHGQANVSYARYGGILADEPNLWGSSRTGYGTNLGLNKIRAYCMAYGIFISGVMESQQPAVHWLDELCEIANCAAVYDGASLDFIPYCEVSYYGNGTSYTAPSSVGAVAAFTDADFLPEAGMAPVEISTDITAQAGNSLPIGFEDRSAQFNSNTVTISDAMDITTNGAVPGSQKTYTWIKDIAVAHAVGWAQLRRNIMVKRKSFKFNVSAIWSVILTPMDIVTINDPGLSPFAIPVRITKITEKQKERSIQIEAEPYIYGASIPLANAGTPGTLSTPGGSGGATPPGSVNTPIIIETIPQLSTTPQIWVAVSGSDPNYGGCNVWMSTDGGLTYNILGTVTGSQTMGQVYSSDYPTHADPDTTDTLNVDLTMSAGTLPAFTQAQQDSFASLCYVAGVGGQSIPSTPGAGTYDTLAWCLMSPTLRSGNHLEGTKLDGVTPSNHLFTILGTGNFYWIKGDSGYPWDIQIFDDSLIYLSTTENGAGRGGGYADPLQGKRFESLTGGIGYKGVPFAKRQMAIGDYVRSSDSRLVIYTACGTSSATSIGYVQVKLTGPYTETFPGAGANLPSNLTTIHLEYEWSLDSSYARKAGTTRETFTLCQPYGLVHWQTQNWNTGTGAFDAPTNGVSYNILVAGLKGSGVIVDTCNFGVNGGGTPTSGGGTGSTPGGAPLTVPYELISYQAAKLSATNKYALTQPQRRGIYGTPVDLHQIGKPFSYLKDGRIFTLPMLQTYAGVTPLYFKFCAFNTRGQATQLLSEVEAYAFLPSGNVGWTWTTGSGGSGGGGGGGTSPGGGPTGTPIPTGTGGAVGAAGDILLYLPGTYTANQEILRVTPARAITYPANLAGSVASCDTAPAAAVAVTINKGTVGGGAPAAVGTVNFALGAVVGTFVFANAVSLNGTGDYLTFTAPATPDSSFAGASISLYGTRST